MFTSRSRYRDRLGKPVPSLLERVWRGRENLEEMRSNLRKWRGGLAVAVAGATTPQTVRTFSAFQGVPMAEISALVERIDNLLGAALPQMVCQCRTKYCPYCEGKGWLNAADARRISSQGQLPAFSAYLKPRHWSPAVSPSVERNSELERLRLLWLLVGPPDINSPEDDRETASVSADESCSTTT
jgi:hypothetical protein